ncbi:MAG: type II toxin-antitoxin system VapC family toxin [Caulobacter sp.]|nr:type II toxin-antitoxin system VapC family toxin [Caulobacter sp.]
MSDVFDSSALLAFLFREPGGEAVGSRISGGRISAVNAAEVIAKLVDRGYRDEAALAVWSELAMNVIDYDLEQAKQSGLLRRSTRSLGLSLADRACLTLAARLGATAVTADRAWVRQDLGIAVELVR